MYIALILLPWKQWKTASIEYEIYGVLFDRTFVRNIFHASRYLASYVVNSSSKAHTFSFRIPLSSTKFNRNINKRNVFFWNLLILSYIQSSAILVLLIVLNKGTDRFQQTFRRNVTVLRSYKCVKKWFLRKKLWQEHLSINSNIFQYLYILLWVSCEILDNFRQF